MKIVGCLAQMKRLRPGTCGPPDSGGGRPHLGFFGFFPVLGIFPEMGMGIAFILLRY